MHPTVGNYNSQLWRNRPQHIIKVRSTASCDLTNYRSQHDAGFQQGQMPVQKQKGGICLQSWHQMTSTALHETSTWAAFVTDLLKSIDNRSVRLGLATQMPVSQYRIFE